jgi:hypothetical protein
MLLSQLPAPNAYIAVAQPNAGCDSRACVERVQRKAEARAIRRLAPYRCSFGRAAIPCYVVMCESRGHWDAYNASGARGPYQLMPMWGAPWPVRTRADRLAHHRIAARLWNHGRGAGNWACA